MHYGTDLPERFTFPARRLAAAFALLEARGVDTRSMFLRAGIDPDVLGNESASVSVVQLEKLLDELWKVTDDELIGLGRQPVPLGSFRLLVYAALGKTSLGGVINRLLSCQEAVPGMPSIFLTQGKNDKFLKIGFDIEYDEQPVPVLVDTFLILVHGYFSWLVRRRIPLVAVDVPYDFDSDLQEHQQLFAAPVNYGAHRPGLWIDPQLLSEPIARGDKEINEFLRHAAAHMLARQGGQTTLSARVRSLFALQRPGLPPMSVDRVAADLAMSPQTLRRRLQEEGTSPRVIREDVLCDLAVAGLIRGEPVHSLAHRLGFSEPSTFSRAFRRWTGSPPGEFQRMHAVERYG